MLYALPVSGAASPVGNYGVAPVEKFTVKEVRV